MQSTNNSALELVPIAQAEQSKLSLSGPRSRRARAEALREAVARALATPGIGSNFGSMLDRMFIEAGQETCRACLGEGIVVVPERVRRDFAERERTRRHECVLLEAAIKDLRQDERENFSKICSEEIRLLAIERNIREIREELGRAMVCRVCRGSRYEKRRGRTRTPRDGIFTTVSCPRCRGTDKRKHPSLPNHHHGSSTGEIWTRNDATAETQDQCPECMGRDGMGTGYVVPITVRPATKTSDMFDDPLEYLNDDEVARLPKFERYTSADMGQAWLDQLDADDPELARAVACFLGEPGDNWSEHIWGRRFALAPLTKAGQELAAVDGPALDYQQTLAAVSRLRMAVIEGADTDPRRRSLIARTVDETLRIERRIERALEE